MLMSAGVILSVAVLAKFNFNPSELLDKASSESEGGNAIVGPGLQLDSPAARDLDGADDLPRHRGATAHPDALLHGARLERRA